MCVCVCAHVHVLSHVWLFVTPWTVDHRAPLSIRFYRQEYWSGLPPGDFPNPGIEPMSLASSASPALTGRFFIPITTWKTICIYAYIHTYLCMLTSPVAQMIKRLPTMQETQVRSLGWEDPLEKEMATHSSILAWRIPWMEVPGELQQSMVLQRVGHNWVTFTSLHICMYTCVYMSIFFIYSSSQQTLIGSISWLL